jgi:signal transduction histidine kinase
MIGLPNILLSICIVCNVGLAVFIYTQDRKSHTNRMFAMFVIFLALWAAVLVGYNLVTDLTIALYLLKSSYVAALLIGVTFYFFSIYFPSDKDPSRDHQLMIFLPAIALILAIFSPTFLTLGIIVHPWGKETVLGLPEYLTFVGFFTYLFVGGLLRIWWKGFQAKKRLLRMQLFAIAGSVSIAGALGMYFNLILPSPFFEDFRYVWSGPLFTFCIAITITYSIFRFRLFNAKAILAELLVFFLWISILTQTLLAEPGQAQLISLGLLIMVILVGILLMRSVHAEVETRERVEKLAQNLEEANTRLRELDRQKSEFIGIAAHQLRTPIAAIKGYSSLILEGSYGKTTKSLHEVTKTIFDSSARMADTIADFLNVTRIEQGKMEYHMETMDLSETVASTIATFQLAAKEKKLSLTFETDTCPQSAHTIIADPGKIQHVINNLIDNAIKYTPAGAVTVRILCDQQKRTIRVEVKDTGAGIPEDAIGGLFMKFVRARNAKNINVTGSGLGLFVAREMIEAHKGRIWAESAGEGKGSTFIFELPLANPNDIEQSAQSGSIRV